MTLISRIKPLGLLRYGAMIFAMALAGCDREQIKVQQVPKESESNPGASTETASTPVNPHAGMDMGAMAAQPKLKWTLPGGWQEKPVSEMRVASFNAQGKEGDAADVSVIPLPSGGAEMELANLNMWRSELQLPAAQKAESEPVTIGPGQGKLFEIADGKTPGRILVAVLDREGMDWYFKMRGGDAVVREQKPAFLDFLKSVSFEAGSGTVAAADPHASMMTEAAPAAASANSGVAVPAGWKEVPPTQFLLAKYLLQGSGDAMAEVSVSMLAGQGGGVMANVNRWRGQLGLSPLSEDDLSKQASAVQVAGGQGTLVDMSGTDAKTGKPARLIGVIAPQTDQTWFYKLMGDDQVVGQQKDAFTKFIQTAKFSNAP